ncbi:MAG TPA: DUF4166 domain-containing protein [Candidatus Angelobacter sp.]
MQVPSIYAQVLGPAFCGLAPALKRLHGSQPRRFTGILTVRTGSHSLARLSLWLARLPMAQGAVPCCLCLIPSHRGERWQRLIGSSKFITDQRLAVSKWNWHGNGPRTGWKQPANNAEIREQFGPITLLLHLRVKGQSLWVRSIRTWILGIPLPGWLGIKVLAHERPLSNDSFNCNIRVYLPGLRPLLRYTGRLVIGDDPFPVSVSGDFCRGGQIAGSGLRDRRE